MFNLIKSKIKKRIYNIIRKILLDISNETIDYCCILGQGSKVYKCAKIANCANVKERIKIGCYTHIAGNLQVSGNAGEIEIGDYSFVGENTRIWSVKKILIGNRVQIAHGCNIFDNNIHSLNCAERHIEYIQNISENIMKLFDVNEKDLIIKDDAWIGANVIILKGVTIGEGAIVGAGSVVLKDVPDYTLVVGNPAQIKNKIK